MPSTINSASATSEIIPDYPLEGVEGSFLTYEEVYEQFVLMMPSEIVEEWESSKFQKTTDTDNKDAIVYPYQVEISKTIVLTMLMNKMHGDTELYRKAMLLMAEMQSGKSATFLNVVFIIKHNGWIHQTLGIRNILILLTMCDNELLDQIREDSISKVGGKKFLEKTWPKVHICHGQNVKTTIDRMEKTNALIIIDECDYAQDINQKPDEVLKHFNVINNGEKAPLKNNNVYSLNVSATPMSELVMTRHNERKSVFFLKSTDDYYSISKMLSRGKVHDAYDILENPEKFKVLIKDTIEAQRSKKYIVVRASTRRYKQTIELFNEICEENDMNVIELNQESASELDFNESMVPEKHTIVVIKRFWTAGKQMDSKNVALVFDYITDNTRADTCIQSLIGRCCGYFKEAHKVEIYSSIEMAKEYETFVQSGFQEVPENTRNVMVHRTNGNYSSRNQQVYNKNNIDEALTSITYEDLVTFGEVKEISKKVFGYLKEKDNSEELVKVKGFQNTIENKIKKMQKINSDKKSIYKVNEQGFVTVDYVHRNNESKVHKLYTMENINELVDDVWGFSHINKTEKYMEIFPVYKSTQSKEYRYLVLHRISNEEQKKRRGETTQKVADIAAVSEKNHMNALVKNKKLKQ